MEIILKVDDDSIDLCLHIPTLIRKFKEENKPHGWRNGSMYTNQNGKNIYVYNTKANKIVVDIRQ